MDRMKAYVLEFSTNPTIIEFARTLVMDCPPKDKVCEIKQIHALACERIRFVDDPVHNEAIVTPLKMLEDIRKNGRVSGDCDEFSPFVCTLLASIGIMSCFRFGGRGTELYHVWSQAQLPNGQWCDLDPSCYLHPGYYYTFPKYEIMEIFD
jgi:hypothetical protein